METYWYAVLAAGTAWLSRAWKNKYWDMACLLAAFVLLGVFIGRWNKAEKQYGRLYTPLDLPGNTLLLTETQTKTEEGYAAMVIDPATGKRWGAENHDPFPDQFTIKRTGVWPFRKVKEIKKE